MNGIITQVFCLALGFKGAKIRKRGGKNGGSLDSLVTITAAQFVPSFTCCSQLN